MQPNAARTLGVFLAAPGYSRAGAVSLNYTGGGPSMRAVAARMLLLSLCAAPLAAQGGMGGGQSSNLGGRGRDFVAQEAPAELGRRLAWVARDAVVAVARFAPVSANPAVSGVDRPELGRVVGAGVLPGFDVVRREIGPRLVAGVRVYVADEEHAYAARPPGRVELRRRTRQRSLSAAVVAHEDDGLETRGDSRARHGTRDFTEQLVGDGDRAGEAHVSGRRTHVARRREGDGRIYQRVVQSVGDSSRHPMRDEVVLAGHHVRPVLLGRAGVNDGGGLARRDGGADFGPGQFFDVDGVRGLGG